MLAYSCAAGLFVVPIFAAVQSWAGEDRRARVIGAVNTLNSIYMVAGSLATTALLKLAGLSELAAMTLLGVANFAAAIYLFRRLPANFLVFALRTAWRVALRLEVVGFDTLPPAGSRNIVAINHISLLDAPIILSLLEDRPLLVVDAALARTWWIRQLLRLCDARLLDPAHPLAARELVDKARKGRRLVLFPGRPQRRHRIADQGVRRRGDDRRQGGRDDHAGQDRRPRPLAPVASADGARPPQLVSQDEGDVPAGAAADRSIRSSPDARGVWRPARRSTT